MSLRSKTIRLAHSQPALRGYLLPLLKVKKVAKLLPTITQSLVKTIRATPALVSYLRESLKDYMLSSAERLERRNRTPPTPPAPPKTRGRKKAPQPEVAPAPHVVTPVTPERVVADTFGDLNTELISSLPGIDLSAWFIKAIEDAANDLYFNYPPWALHPWVEVGGGEIKWRGTLVGSSVEEQELPGEHARENKRVEELFELTGGVVDRLNDRVRFLRDYGSYGSYVVVYEFQARWPLNVPAIFRELFPEKDLLEMATEAIAKAEA